MQACNNASMHPCKHAPMQACTYASMHPCKYAPMQACTYASMHPCKHAPMHASKHTHATALPLKNLNGEQFSWCHLKPFVYYGSHPGSRDQASVFGGVRHWFRKNGADKVSTVHIPLSTRYAVNLETDLKVQSFYNYSVLTFTGFNNKEQSAPHTSMLILDTDCMVKKTYHAGKGPKIKKRESMVFDHTPPGPDPDHDPDIDLSGRHRRWNAGRKTHPSQPENIHEVAFFFPTLQTDSLNYYQLKSCEANQLCTLAPQLH